MNRGNLLYLSAAIAATTACAGSKAPSVDGKWVIAAATLGGQGIPPGTFNGSALEMSAGKYAFQGDSGEYMIHGDAMPMLIDVHGLKGPNAGRTIPAIFRFDGDTLTICYDLSGQARPKEFRSDPGTQFFLVRYVRSKPVT